MASSQDAHNLMVELSASSLDLRSESSQRETADILDQLALQLRSSEPRDSLSQTTLPSTLVQILLSVSPTSFDESTCALIQQTGRVAANLAANCDPGRDGLVTAGYIDKCCDALSLCAKAIDVALLAVRALTASLLNMVIEGHEPSIQALAKNSNCSALFEVLDALLVGQQGEEAEQMTGWIWNILSLVLEEHPDNSFIPRLIRPFQVYQQPSSIHPPSLQTLASCADILDSWGNTDQVDYEPYTTAQEALVGETAISVMMDFVQRAELPGEDKVDGAEPGGMIEAVKAEEAEEEEATEEAGDGSGPSLGKIKGTLINALVGLSTVIPATYQPFWTAMRAWLDRLDRDDLQCCALLSFGNQARDDLSATALLSEPDSILPSILAISRPGITAQLLHAVIGLIRNLSIPEHNKVVLGKAGIMDRLVELEVWSKDKDMLGSVQGGSVGIVKNLCRGNLTNSKQLANHTEATHQILELLQRTDDPAIRFESSRVFVNCITSLASAGQEERPTLLKMEEERIVTALISMFRESEPYPVLANESIVALTLLVTFGERSYHDIIGAFSGVSERILDILAPKEGAEESSREVRANMVTLLRQANSRGQGGLALWDQVTAALGSFAADARQVSEEAKGLIDP